MQLTKTQVLALFLGSSSAATLTNIALLNGPSTDKVPADQTKTNSMSGTDCSANGNAGCDYFNKREKCGFFQLAEGDQAQMSDICVAENFCSALGKLNGVGFSVNCWEDPAEGVTATRPAAVDVATYLTQIEDLITKDNFSFKDATNLLISPKFNFQDGWWIEDADGNFVETDKAADQRCIIDGQCTAEDGTEMCCGLYPDANNKRCMAKSISGVKMTVGPISITPSCSAQEPDVEPENAGEDIAKGALAQAAEALSEFYDNQEKDAKLAAKYDDMTAEEKAAWDEKYAATVAERKKFWDDLKTEVGFAELGDAEKAVFEEDLLAWGKTFWTTCKEDPDSIACREGQTLKKKLETARAGKGEGETNYYKMSAEDRKKFDEGWAEQAQKNKAALAAAWLDANEPAAGENGAKCGENGLCPEGQCCGYSVPPKPAEDGVATFDSAQEAGEALGGLMEGMAGLTGDSEAASAVGGLTDTLSLLGGAADLLGSVAGRVPEEGERSNVCVKSASINEGTKTKWTNALNEEWTHTCLAKNLAATAAATMAVAYSLM